MGFRKLASGPALRVNQNAPMEQNRALGEFTTSFLSSDQGYGYGGYSAAYYRQIMAIPAAWRASTLISGLVGQLPWHGYRDQCDAPAIKIEPCPQLLADPSPPRTRVEVISSLMLDYLIHGNAIAVIASRNADGWPTSFVPVPAVHVHITYADGAVVYGVDGLRLEPVIYRIGEWYGTAADVIHIKGPCAPGELRGMGVLEAASGTFDLAREQQNQAKSLAIHGVPTGTLKATDPSVSPLDLKEAKAGWLEAQRTRTIAGLSPSIEFQPISWNPEELQLVEARKFSIQEIGLMFGLPGRYLGVEVGGLSYSTPVLDSQDLLRYTLGAHLARFEQELTRHLPRGTWAKANVDALLRADTMSRYEAHAVALAAGFMTVNEVRALEDLPPLAEPVEVEDEEEEETPDADPDSEAEADEEEAESVGEVEPRSDDEAEDDKPTYRGQLTVIKEVIRNDAGEIVQIIERAS